MNHLIAIIKLFWQFIQGKAKGILVLSVIHFSNDLRFFNYEGHLIYFIFNILLKESRMLKE
jgi:hypothetical protein